MSRRFPFALLAAFLLWSAFAPAQNSRAPKPSSPANVNPSSAAPTEPAKVPAAQSAAPESPKPCDYLEQRTKLSGAQYEFDNLHLESAASQYAALISSSCDEGIRASAAAGYERAHAVMSTWWWIEGRYFPPLRWHHHPRFWQAVRRTLLIIVLILVILWPFFYLTDLRAFHWFTAPFAMVQQKMRRFFLADRLPRASIMSPSGLTDTTQANLFASVLESSSEEVRRVLERAGGGLQVRATALLALPSQTTSALVDSLPKVKGVDVAGIAKFFLYLKRYLGWRVESEIGYCPPTTASDGTQSPARVVASASLRHAFWVRGGPWPVQRPVQHAYDIDGVAFAIAARIMGFNMRGNRAR